MKRFVIALCVLAMPALAAPVGAELCQTCKGRYYPGDLGKCVVCGKESGGGAFVLCKKCSARLGQCEHCRAPLKGARPVLKSARVDTKKSGVYALGKWKYEYNIGAAGTRNENRLGRLSYDGKPIAGKEYDRIWTPWGLMQHFGQDVSLSKHTVHAGWLLKRYRDGPLYLETGRLLPSPDAPANPPAPLELDDSANGKKVSAVVRQRIIIRLDSNPRPWYWLIGKVEGEGKTIVHVDKGKYVSRDHKGAKGFPGRFIFTFLATRPGTARVTLKYRKASRRKMQTPVLKTFTLTVAVKPNPAVERVKKLKANLEQLRLYLDYHGPQHRLFYDLGFTTAVERPTTYPAFLLVSYISKSQAIKIIDYLGSDGFLGRSMNLSGIKLAKPPAGPTYTIRAYAGGLALYENLGWDLKMLKRLDGLRKVLDGDAAKAMDKLLARMSGHRKQWEKAVAISKPVVKPIKKPLAPDKSPLHVQLARVCDLSKEQQKKIDDLIVRRDKAMKDFYAGMAAHMIGIKRMVAEARASEDKDLEKAAFARMRSVQASEGQIKRQWQAKFIAVLKPAQEVKWFQYQARWVIDKYRKANLTADQITKIKTAYVKQMMGVDLTDAKALGEAGRKIHDYITTKVLTDAQRKAMKPPPEPVVVPERAVDTG